VGKKQCVLPNCKLKTVFWGMEIIEYRYRDGGIKVGHERVYGRDVSWWDVLKGLVDVEAVARGAIAEFREHEGGVDIVHPWWQGKEGDWVLADDGRIIRVLKVGVFGGEMRRGGKVYGQARSRGYVKTVVGTFPVPRPGMKTRVMMDTDVRWHPDRHKLAQTVPGTFVNPKDRGAMRLSRRGIDDKILRMVRATVTGMDAWDAYLLYFGRRGSEGFLERRFNRVISSPEFIQTMDKVVSKLAEEVGVGAKAILERYKELLDMSMEGLDPRGKDFRVRAAVAKDVLVELSKINGIRDQGLPVMALPMGFAGEQRNITGGAIDRIERVSGRLSQAEDAQFQPIDRDDYEQEDRVGP
jgi:hypothetical protein